MATDKKIISVFIPVFNGEKYLAECIDSILAQKLPRGFDVELLITDSGSTDNSVAIIESYGNQIVFDRIPNEMFNHGSTRQRAAEKAKGDYILFLSQDATPMSDRWAISMIEPFKVSEQIGCVFGRQIPRPDAVPSIKREVSSVFESFGAGNSIVIHNQKNLVDDFLYPDYNYFFSDVNSAIRKSRVKEVPFRHLAYAEDMALAEDMQAKGYLKAYSARGSVWHSNEYSVDDFRKRKFDEYIGLFDSIGTKVQPSLRSLLLGWIRPTLRDWQFTLRDPEYDKKMKLRYLLLSAAYNIAHQRAKYEASTSYANPEKRKRLSYESKWKSGSDS